MRNAQTGHIVFAKNRKDLAYWAAAGYQTIEHRWV